MFKMFNIFGKKASKAENVNNTVSAINFDKICTIMQFNVCKDIITACKASGDANGNIYSIADVEKAKSLLSECRKTEKTSYDRFMSIRQRSSARTDTAKAIGDTAIAHTSMVQEDIHKSALGALNYALKKYNHCELVSVTEIKSAFAAMQDCDIYKYYSISSMQYNAKALLSKCLTLALKAKIQAEKAKIQSGNTNK